MMDLPELVTNDLGEINNFLLKITKMSIFILVE